MSATGRLSKRAFCLAVVVMLALATIPSVTLALALRSRQERLPAELSLADAIAIYIERDATPPGNKNIASDEAQRRGIRRVKEAFHESELLFPD
jgi:hypothetical protein